MKEFHEPEPPANGASVMPVSVKRSRPWLAFGCWVAVLLANDAIYYLYSVSGFFRGFGQFPYYFTISAGTSVAIWIGLRMRHSFVSFVMPVLVFSSLVPLQTIGLWFADSPKFWEIFQTQVVYTEFQFGIICVELYLVSRGLGVYLVRDEERLSGPELGVREILVATMAIAVTAAITRFIPEGMLADDFGASVGKKDYLGWVAIFALVGGGAILLMTPFWIRFGFTSCIALATAFALPAIAVIVYDYWRVSVGEGASGFGNLLPFVVGDFLGKFSAFIVLRFCGYRLARASRLGRSKQANQSYNSESTC